MNRRTFVKSSMFGVAGVTLIPTHMIINEEFSNVELIGKGNPKLYGKGQLMRKKVFDTFLEMKTKASEEDIDLKIVSGYRDFYRQKAIYESKYKRYTKQGLSPAESIEKIIEYSTIPGTSRHHWGTDIDIVDGSENVSGDVLVPGKFHGNGPYCKFKEWMNEHAESFGFYEVYTDNANRKGFKYEPWHFSYRPLSVKMMKAYLTIDIKQVLIEEQLMGKEYITDAFINKYKKYHIMDINPELLP